MGWRHFLAASSWSCPWSSPREAGAAKSGPMTLNRKCAQRSWDREVDDVSFIGCRYFHFPHLFGGAARVYTRIPAPVARHPLRDWERASHNELFPGSRGGDRSQKLEQLQKPVAPFDPKAHAQWQGHRLWAQRRHKPGASFSPKRAFHEEDQPPLTPPFKSAAVDPHGLTQQLYSLGLQAVNHGRHQYHDQSSIR